MEDQVAGGWLKKALLGGPTWFVGFVSGLAAALAPDREARRAASRERFIADWRHRVKKSLADEPEGSRTDTTEVAVAEGQTLTQLRQSLMGAPKVLVSTFLGRPASAFYSGTHSAAPSSAYWEADIWYYPADLRRREALAIHFEDDRVASVERLVGPGH